MDEPNLKTTKESLAQPINRINQNNNNNENIRININKNNNPSTLNQEQQQLHAKTQSNHVTLNLKHEISLEDINANNKGSRDIKLASNALRIYKNNEKGYNSLEGKEKENINIINNNNNNTNTLNYNYDNDATECLLINRELYNNNNNQKEEEKEEESKPILKNFSSEHLADDGSNTSNFLNYVNFLSSDEAPLKLIESKSILSTNKEKSNAHHLLSSLPPTELTSNVNVLNKLPSNMKKASASSNEFDEEDLDDYKDYLFSSKKANNCLNSISIESTNEASNLEKKNSLKIFNANSNFINNEQHTPFIIPNTVNSPKSIKRHSPKDDHKLHTELRNLINNQTNLPRINKSTIKVTIEPTSDSVSLNNEHESIQETPPPPPPHNFGQYRRSAADPNVSGIVDGGVGSSIKKFTKLPSTDSANTSPTKTTNLFDIKKINSNSSNLTIKNIKLANTINLNASTTFLDKDSTYLKANNTNKNNLHRGSSSSNSPFAHVGQLNLDDPIEKHARNCECDNCRLQNETNNEDQNEPKATYSYLKSYFVSMLQPSDNKLAMKLFGSKKGVLKEKLRQQEVGHWIIHPCSNFR
jgi:hypothetical protein